MREYPEISENFTTPIRPISFVCVKYCNEFQHNILKSECIHDPLNEFIVVDNTSNLFFTSMAQAILEGANKAKHDLIVVVHEDVLLLPGWQAMFEQSLNALEQHDPEWMVAGVVGWNADGAAKGHWSDPHKYRDTLMDEPFAEVNRIDEQILILRKSKGLFLDPNLPSIHHIGRTLPIEAEERGLKAYVVNAPSIHKYADQDGELILSSKDSEKIKYRASLAYLADRACADEYVMHKWPILNGSASILGHNQPGPWKHARPPKFLGNDEPSEEKYKKILNSPVIFLAKGGGGSRLVSTLANDLNMFIGNDVNEASGDSREMARSIYRVIMRKFKCSSELQRSYIVPDLRTTASQMLEQAEWPEVWSFKLPESIFILPELREAFPNATYVYFNRDPLTSVLRRTHMTARLENQIGQLTLPMAYQFYNLDINQIFVESEMHHKCRTTVHQLELIANFRSTVEDKKWLDLSFEQFAEQPEVVLSKLSKFTGMDITSRDSLSVFDKRRASIQADVLSGEDIFLAESMLQEIRQKLGY